MTDTITVKIRDTEAERRAWGSPGLFYPAIRTIKLPRYTERGERRSDPVRTAYYEDGVPFALDRWTLDSGRVETYTEVLLLIANQPEKSAGDCLNGYTPAQEDKALDRLIADLGL